jgi:hypothetical protein
LSYVIYLYVKNIYFNTSGIEGQYVRIYGDSNQPKYLDNIKHGRMNTYIYYDDNHTIIDEGTANPSLFKKEHSATHTNSSSVCKKLYLSNDKTVSECTGYAAKKFNKNNVNYKSFHNYYRVGNAVYYENTYFYDDGDISFAIYKKI